MKYNTNYLKTKLHINHYTSEKRMQNQQCCQCQPYSFKQKAYSKLHLELWLTECYFTQFQLRIFVTAKSYSF